MPSSNNSDLHPPPQKIQGVFFSKKIISIFTCLLIISGCSTPYQPLKIDGKSGFYATSVQVDPGGVMIYNTTIDPTKFRFVLLLTDSNIRPTVFAFTIRQALAQSGIFRVFTPEEFLALAKDRGLLTNSNRLSPELVKQFAAAHGDTMIVDYSQQHLGDANFYATLKITDGQNGNQLLRVDHRRLNWSNIDEEVMYPVLNQLRRWVNQSRKGAA